jgi:hypothetical protein
MEWFQVPPEPAAPAEMEVVSAQLSADEARVLTDQARQQARELWRTLLRLYEGGAHTALGYASWAEYFNAEFRDAGDRLDPKHPYRLLRAARVEAEISVHVDTEGMREAQARVLAPLDAAMRAEIARRVAEEGGFGVVSAGRVREIRDEVAGLRRVAGGRLVWDERALRGAASAVLRVGQLAGAFADLDGLRELAREDAANVRTVISAALADMEKARLAAQYAEATLQEAARVLDDRGDLPPAPSTGELTDVTARDVMQQIKEE